MEIVILVILLIGGIIYMGISIREDNSGRKYYTNIFIYK